jgi:ribosomal protection tetracycline resistance protein
MTAPLRPTRWRWNGSAAARVHELRAELPALTRGEGVLECSFDRYEPVTGVAPTRPRTDDNPLNREEYLQRVTRRASLTARA